MIPVSFSDAKLPEQHYKAIRGYFSTKIMAPRFDILESMILEFSDNELNFEKLVKASVSTLKEKAIPAWDKFEEDNDLQKYEQSIQLLHNLYTYLGSNKYRVQENGDGPWVTYNTEYLFKKLDICVCPYCNENYTYHYNTKGGRNYDIDHFFSKKKYPIASVSFFNLIPSCKVCNFHKLDQQQMILSPHEKYTISDLWKCQLKIDSTDYLVDNSKFIIQSEFAKETPLTDLIKESIEMFKLMDRYNERKDIIGDILKKKQLYNSDYIDSLFSQYEGSLFRDVAQVRSMIFGATLLEGDYHKRPFSKLIHDLFNDEIV